MEDIMQKIQEMLSDEESMNQIKELAEMLNGAEGADKTEQASVPKPEDESPASENSGNSSEGFGFDLGTLFQIQSIMQSVSSNDKNAELLLALRPHLKEEKQQRVDKAVKLLKLFAIYTVVKESGLLKSIDLL